MFGLDPCSGFREASVNRRTTAPRAATVALFGKRCRLLSVIPGSILGGYSRERWLRYLRDPILEFWAGVLDNQTIEDAAWALDMNYAPWPYVEDRYSNRDQMNQVGDPFFFPEYRNLLGRLLF